MVGKSRRLSTLDIALNLGNDGTDGRSGVCSAEPWKHRCSSKSLPKLAKLSIVQLGLKQFHREKVSPISGPPASRQGWRHYRGSFSHGIYTLCSSWWFGVAVWQSETSKKVSLFSILPCNWEVYVFCPFSPNFNFTLSSGLLWLCQGLPL